MEDMDLSLRTFVNGWKAIYLHDVTCLNEVGMICMAGHVGIQPAAAERCRMCPMRGNVAAKMCLIGSPARL